RSAYSGNNSVNTTEILSFVMNTGFTLLNANVTLAVVYDNTFMSSLLCGFYETTS
ncbi:MAG: hypothetical protein K0R59_2801, partial [Sphingobacterium sp.]|nr:hypothetical protein [Sphingobacterium sp.]